MRNAIVTVLYRDIGYRNIIALNYVHACKDIKDVDIGNVNNFSGEQRCDKKVINVYILYEITDYFCKYAKNKQGPPK